MAVTMRRLGRLIVAIAGLCGHRHNHAVPDGFCKYRSRCCRDHDPLAKIRQVVVPWTSRRPLLSVTRPSAVPTRRPQLITLPSALIRPVCGVIGRTKDILNSSVVEPVPFSSIEWIASPPATVEHGRG